MSTIYIFKPSGKWYATGTVNMQPFANDLIHDALFKACEAEHKDGTGWPLSTSPRSLFDREDEGWSIVCVEPNHPHSHPIMLKQMPR